MGEGSQGHVVVGGLLLLFEHLYVSGGAGRVGVIFLEKRRMALLPLCWHEVC